MPMPSKWIRNRTIASMYRDGMTMDEIAVRYGITKQRVAVVLRDMTGLTARPRGRRAAQERPKSSEVA